MLALYFIGNERKRERELESPAYISNSAFRRENKYIFKYVRRTKMKFRFDIDYEVEEDGIIYRAVRNDEDAAKTRDFYLDIFLKNEPATKSCGGYAQRHPGMVKQIDEYIADGVSIIAVDPNRDGFVVGIRTGFVVDK